VKATLEARARPITLGGITGSSRSRSPQTPAIKLKKDGSRQGHEEKVFPGLACWSHGSR